MENRRFFYINIILLLGLFSCGQRTVSSYDNYLEWLNDEQNGLVKQSEVGGITMKVKCLPSNYLAYQDLVNEKSINKEEVDSIIKSYDKSLTFLLTIGVDGDLKKGDVMYQGINNYEQYKERLHAMNFDIENQISLNINNKQYHPVLSNLENAYGLVSSRSVTVVFVPETEKEEAFYATEEVQFTYDDELFKTGINHFTFNREDINNTPSFIFWN